MVKFMCFIGLHRTFDGWIRFIRLSEDSSDSIQVKIIKCRVCKKIKIRIFK